MFDFEEIEKELAELSLIQKSATDELIDIAEPIVKDKQLRLEYQMLEDIECCRRKEMKL